MSESSIPANSGCGFDQVTRTLEAIAVRLAERMVDEAQ